MSAVLSLEISFLDAASGGSGSGSGSSETMWKPVDWSLVAQVEREGDANDTVLVALALLTQTVFRGGIDVEFSEVDASQPRRVNDWFREHVLDAEWQPCAERMLRHLIYFGFVAVRYVRSPRCGEIVPSVLEANTYSLHYLDALQAGTGAGAGAGARAGASSRIETGRRYAAFPEPPDPGPRHPIPNVRIFVVSDPDALGRLVSPLHSVLRALSAVDTLWQNLLDADRERTHPAYIYERVGTHSAASTALRPGAEETLDWGDNDALVHESQVRGFLDASDRAAEVASISEARRQNAVSLQRQYDKTRRSLVAAAVPLPWEKSKHVPVDRRLAAPPVPQTLPDFRETIHLLSSRISLACGVPIVLLGDGGHGAAAASGGDATHAAAQSILRDNVLTQQRRLAAMLVRIYMDVYGDAHEQEFERGVVSAQHALQERLSVQEISALRRHFTARVRFRSTPIYSYEDVVALREQHVIGRDDMQRLALNVFNLPETLALPLEQERTERRAEAEMLATEERLVGEAAAIAGAKAGSTSGSTTKSSSTATTSSSSSSAKKARAK